MICYDVIDDGFRVWEARRSSPAPGERHAEGNEMMQAPSTTAVTPPPHGSAQAEGTRPTRTVRTTSLTVIGLLAAWSLIGLAPTAHAGDVWRAGSVLTITEAVQVRDSLVIEAGVTAYFAESASIDVLSGATLTIEGTAELPVRLLPLDPEFAWIGVWFLPGSGGSVRHMELTGANSIGLAIFESSPLVEYCRIGETAGFDGSPLRSGIQVSGLGAAPVIRRCVIESIRGYSPPQANAGTNGTNGPNGSNGVLFGDKNGGPGTAGNAGGNGVAGIAPAGSAIGIWVRSGAAATIESNVIRWIHAGNGPSGGNGGAGGDGGNGGLGYSGGQSPGNGGVGAAGGIGGHGGSGGPGGGAHGIFVDQAGGDVLIAGNAIYAIAGGRGGNGGNGGAGGDGGDGGNGGSCSFCSQAGAGGSGGAAAAGGAGGAAGPSGVTRAISIQLPLAPSLVQVVNNSVALILPPAPAAGGIGGPAGAFGLGGFGGDSQFGNDGADGAQGVPAADGTSAAPGTVLLAFGVSAAGAGLTVETRNHASHLNPAGVPTSGSAAFRAEVGAQMSVSHSLFAGQTVLAVGAVSFGPSSLNVDPAFVAPPLAIPIASDCCTWVGGQTGCGNLACEAVVCGKDPTCCNTAWDLTCAELAGTLCSNLSQPLADVHLSLAATSPAIDVGLNAAVPALLATDLDVAPRVADGDGNGIATVDAGAYESPELRCGVDLTCDGSVDGADLAMLLGAWGACSSPCIADLDGSGTVDGADLATLLGAWK
jgi:hypothetical protein